MAQVVAVTGSGEGPYPDLITLDEDGFLWRASATSSGEYRWEKIEHPTKEFRP